MLFLLYIFFIAYAPPPNSNQISPPSIGAWSGGDGNEGWASSGSMPVNTIIDVVIIRFFMAFIFLVTVYLLLVISGIL